MAGTSTLTFGKRPRDADPSEKDNTTSDSLRSAVKKRRRYTADVLISPQLAAKESKSNSSGPDPYFTLPAPANSWIQLRFQLNRFQGVYRVAQVPTNYTFGNMHTLIQYLFGWSGRHSHKTRVYTNVEMYKSANRKGSIKSYGQAPAIPEGWIIPNLSEEMQEETLNWWNISNGEAAIYEVVATGKNQGKSINSRGYFSDYSWHYKVEDQELTLGDVWNLDEEKNVSKGEYGNRNIGLIYEYELDAPWSIHITLDDGFYQSESPGNDVFVNEIHGAPSVEEKNHWASDHPSGAKKAVSDLFLMSTNWKRYCRKELITRTLPDQLVAKVVQTRTMTEKQAEAKQAKLEAQAAAIRMSRDEEGKERKRRLRAQRKLEREIAARRAFEDSDTPECSEYYSSDLY